MNPLLIKYGPAVAQKIADEAKDFAIDHYSNPMARKLAEWSYITQAKARAKEDLKRQKKEMKRFEKRKKELENRK